MCRAAVVLERQAEVEPTTHHLIPIYRPEGAPLGRRESCMVGESTRRPLGRCERTPRESELREMGRCYGMGSFSPPSSAAPPVSFRRGVEPIVSSRVPPRPSSLSTLALLRTSAPARGRAISNTRSRGLPLPSYPGSSRGIHTHTLSTCRLDVGSPGRWDGPGVRGGDQGKGGARSSGGRHAIVLNPPTYTRTIAMPLERGERRNSGLKRAELMRRKRNGLHFPRSK